MQKNNFLNIQEYNKEQFLIYALVDPFTKEIRYIGKSCTGLKRPRENRAKAKGTKSFKVLDSLGNCIGIWCNKSACSRDLDISRKTISKGLAGKLNSKFKYRFEEVI